MRFNIKKWQDKYLIQEARLKELDFKDQNAFKKYSSQHKIQPNTQVTIGGKTTTAGEASKDKSTPQQKKSVVGDSMDKMFYSSIHGHLRVDITADKLAPIYISGMSKEDAKAEIKSKMDPATNVHLQGKDPKKLNKILKKADKELDSLLDRMYTGEFGTPQDLQQTIKQKEKAEKEKLGKEKAEKAKAEKAKTQFQFSEYDYATPKEFRDQAKNILQKTYDLDKVDPDELEEIIKSADDYFYQEARSENKRGREVDPTSVEEYADYMDMAFENYGIEPKVEESKNIQEASIYRTIQQLRVLEKGI